MVNGNALHVYYGEGKGKTTAAMGRALRALGQGKHVLIAQFMKRNDSGELTALAGLQGAHICPTEPIDKFTGRMTPEELLQEKKRQARNLDAVERQVEAVAPDMIVLDEVLVAIHTGLLDGERVLRLAEKWLKRAELVCTGRWKDEALAQRADYVTRMVSERHPYEKGIAARRGIEW